MFRRTVSVLAAAVALATAGSTVQVSAADGVSRPGARVLDVMSFNIHHAQGTDGVLDIERIARVVRGSGADVVGLQEVDNHYSARSEWADQSTELAAALGYHVVFGANIDNAPPAGSEHRVQYASDHLPLLSKVLVGP